MYEFAYICMLVSCTYICVNVSKNKCKYLQSNVCMSVSLCVCMKKYMDIFICFCIRICEYMYVCTYTCIVCVCT